MQTVATAVETFAAVLETQRWVPPSSAARARRPPAQVAPVSPLSPSLPPNSPTHRTAYHLSLLTSVLPIASYVYTTVVRSRLTSSAAPV